MSYSTHYGNESTALELTTENIITTHKEIRKPNPKISSLVAKKYAKS